MPLDIIVGTQWGDEGKGHITDLMASKADFVARFGGGDNAGHTIAIGDDVYKLHLVPSGIIHSHVTCIIGNGVVINPAVLLREIDELKDKKIDVTPQRLLISDRAHLITPGHIALDKAYESNRGDSAIGTTQRGIGPAYTDKATRSGLRANLLANPEALAKAVDLHIASKNEILSQLFGLPALNGEEVATQFTGYGKRLAPYLANTPQVLSQALANGASVLAEGAQGTLLDLDHGTYPFVTSSWPTAAGALLGLGIGPKYVRRVIGVAKAFTSRVGGGPFPSELEGESAARLRGTGELPWDEFGTTTGRPRRVGWLDLVILRHAAQINGLSDLALTKLDILTGLPQIPVCIAYEIDGERTTSFPSSSSALERCRPIYETLPGWSQDITLTRSYEELPANARRYVDFVAETVGVPINLVSVGPGRDQVVQV